MRSRQVIVLGSGAMGSFFGGRLAQAGHRVTLLDVDAEHVDQIRQHGLRMSTRDGDHQVRQVRASAPSEASEHPWLLIVFTKTQHTSTALAQVRSLIDQRTIVLTVQNGLGNLEKLQEVVPEDQIVIGMTTWPAERVGPGHVSSHGQGSIRILGADGSTATASAVAEVLDDADLAAEVDPDVWVRIWEKVAFNAAINPLCALTRTTVDQVADIPEGPTLAAGIVAEVAVVASSVGVRIETARVVETLRAAMQHHVGHQPSMLQDVLAGRQSEIEAINGAVVAIADRGNVAAPATRTLLGLMRLVDARSRR